MINMTKKSITLLLTAAMAFSTCAFAQESPAPAENNIVLISAKEEDRIAVTAENVISDASALSIIENEDIDL